MDRGSVKVVAPATIANVGPGFDVFGLALQEPADAVEVTVSSEPGVRVVSVSGRGSERIPPDARKNTATVAAKEVLRLSGSKIGLEIAIDKGVRPCSGMGSSGASAAGAAYGANLLTGSKLDDNQLVACAAKGERASSGSMHADNVAPCLLGGFTIIRSYSPLDVVRITPPERLGIVAVLPDVIVSTKEARGALPKQIDLRKMVFQVGHASSLSAGMALGDIGLIGRSIGDAVAEPSRAKLVPHLGKAEKVAREAGAVAAFLGGSGPCIAALFDRETADGRIIAENVRRAYEEEGVGSEAWVTTWGKGCRRSEK
ncbi:MAG TPA: homoserine kinase [Methanomassiliicoccales archaeon]|nr:homoserine kinase [Methanomassiliicoccales archaeon]